MSTDNVLPFILRLLLSQLPVIAIAGIGLWFAVTRKQILARVSTCASWGFGLLLTSFVVSVVLGVVMLQWQITAPSDPASMSEDLAWLQFISLAGHPLLIVGIALIARAVFLDR